MLGKVLLFASAATMTALLASGCQSGTVTGSATVNVGAPAATTRTTAPVMSTPPLSAGTSANSGGTTAPVPPPTTAAPVGSQFTNKTLNVILIGYNQSADMLQFQEAVYQKNPTDGGSYVPDPANPGAHQLVVAPAATVLSAVTFCPNGGTPSIDAEGLGTGQCSVTQLIEAFATSGSALGAARIVVDNEDHIVKISEIYHP